ncbi:uncharacterized protein [Antedon mediterranea]|uniref:uncharacterized protein n=1 Tax=Antedon mediterranea TaxID=105859 RepID=UPI003AF4337D
MSVKPAEKKLPPRGLHYHVSNLNDIDPLGLDSSRCDVSQNNTVVDYMTTIERKHYENQNLCRKNGIRGHRTKGGGIEKKRLKRPAPPPPTQSTTKKTLKDIAEEYLTNLDSDYVVTDLNSVTDGTDATESFLQLTTEPLMSKVDDEHLYDSISGHYKKKEVNGCGRPTPEKQDAYYLDIIDDYSQTALPTSSNSYDEIKCKTLPLSERTDLSRSGNSSANREFLNRSKQIMMTEVVSKLPAIRNRRLVAICVASVLLLCSIWLITVATKPKSTNRVIFPTQTHQLVGGTVFDQVTIPEPTPSVKVIPQSDCIQDCREKARVVICASNRMTYETRCDFKVAKCKNPGLSVMYNGSCHRSASSDESEDD